MPNPDPFVEELARAQLRAEIVEMLRGQVFGCCIPTEREAMEFARATLPIIDARVAQAVEELRDHIAEQITFAETRIQDGKDMGAAIWRIALEDIVRENRAALAKLNGGDRG